jgi:hypothetical protein
MTQTTTDRAQTAGGGSGGGMGAWGVGMVWGVRA